MRYLVWLFLLMAISFQVYGQTKPSLGDGTSGNPYQIGAAEELLWFANQVNGGNNTISAILTKDIDYSAYQTMIGNGKGTSAFKGTFDGDGYKITIGFDFPNADLDCVGLIGFVAGNATIKNLNVTGSLTISGQWWHVGSIVGGDDEKNTTKITIDNCNSDVKITATKSEYNNNDIKYDFITLGGVIGVCQKELQMNHCSFTGNINSTSNASKDDRTVIIGGLIGSAKSGKVQNSYVYIDDTMTINQDMSDRYIYPIVGNRNKYSSSYTTENCYYYYEQIVYNSISYNDPGTAKNKDPFTALPANLGDKNYQQSDLNKILAGVDKATGITVMYISSAADMERFAKAVNNGNKTLNAEVRKCFTYSGTSVGTNSYAGTFNGNNHTITLDKTGTNALAENASYGLFYNVNNATINNLNVAGQIEGGKYIGGLMAVNSGANTVVNNCVNSVHINTTTASTNIGGFVQRTDENITFNNCSFAGSISNTGTKYGFISHVKKSDAVLTFNNCYSLLQGIYSYASKKVLNNSYSPLSGSDSHFSSGEICYLLNLEIDNADDMWYQNIGTEPNPVHKKCSCLSGENKVVYASIAKECPDSEIISETASFSNDPAIQSVTILHPNHELDDTYHCIHCDKLIEYDEEGNFMIYNAERLIEFARLVNKEGKRTLNAVVLKDIDYTNGGAGYALNETYTIGTGSWDGSPATAYKGVFDGKYHTITMKLNAGTNSIVGLFRYANGATIKNLVLKGSMTTRGDASAPLVGYNVGTPVTIESVLSMVDITFEGDNNNRPQYSGGLVARALDGFVISNCGYYGTFTNNKTKPLYRCSGLVPATNGDTNDLNDKSTGTFNNCFVKLSVAGTGGFEEANCYSICSEGHRSEFNNCYYDTPFEAKNTGSESCPDGFAGGQVCYMLNDGATDNVVWYQKLGDGGDPTPVLKKCSCEHGDATNYIVYPKGTFHCPKDKGTHAGHEGNLEFTNISGEASTNFGQHEYGDDGTCKFCGQLQLNDEGQFVIYNEARLKIFAKKVEEGYVNLKGLVTRDLDMTTDDYKTVFIGNSYKGVFDGGFNTITIDLKAISNDGTGLFGLISNATIKNLIVSGKITTTNQYCQNIGGIVGNNKYKSCQLERCISTVTIVKSNNEQLQNVGGIIGQTQTANWIVNNCAFTGVLPSGQKNNKNQYVAGIVGKSVTGKVTNSYVYVNTVPNNTDNLNTISSNGSNTSNYYLNKINSTNNAVNKDAATFKSQDGVVKSLNNSNGDIVWYLYSESGKTGLGYDYPTIVGYVWKGSETSDAWNEASNWKMGVVPTDASTPNYNAAIIPAVTYNGAKAPHISTDVSVKSIDILSDAELYVNPADITVNITGTVNNRGLFEISYGDAYSSVQGSPNVVIAGASPANVSVKRHLKPRVMYYTGSATAEGTISEGYSYATNKDYLAFFNAAAQTFDTSIRSQGKFPAQHIGCTVGLGSQSATSFSQVGTIHNTSAMDVALTPGYQWLSNPYPFTAMAWDGDAGKGLLPENSGENMSPTVWTRKSTSGSNYTYVTYNANLGLSAYGAGRSFDDALYIAPFQDYCIMVNNSGTYTINGVLAKKEGNVVYSQLKSAQLEMPKDVVRLNLTTDGKADIDDQAVLVLREDGILGVSNIDSDKYPTSSYSQIAIYKSGSNTKYAIGLYPSAADVEEEEIPVTLTAVKGAKQLTLAADLSGLSQSYDVILIDHATVPETEINLRAEAGYTVAATALTAKRFGVVLRRNENYKDSPVEENGTATDITDIASNGRFIVYSSDRNIVVELGSQDTGGTIQVVDIAGRTVSVIKHSGRYNILPMTQRGVYVVVVGDKSRKIIVK